MVPAGIARSFSIKLWFFCNATINLDIAVAATSGEAICALNALPRASNWSVVIPAVRATPVHRFANSVMSLLVAVDVEANLNMEDPTASMDFSSPIFGIRPITSVIFNNEGRAFSPISSPIATLILSAALTNWAIPSTPYFPTPSLDASYASCASPSTLVLVSILASSVESCFTCSIVKPETLRMSVNEPEYSKFFLMAPATRSFT